MPDDVPIDRLMRLFCRLLLIVEQEGIDRLDRPGRKTEASGLNDDDAANTEYRFRMTYGRDVGPRKLNAIFVVTGPTLFQRFQASNTGPGSALTDFEAALTRVFPNLETDVMLIQNTNMAVVDLDAEDVCVTLNYVYTPRL